MVYLSFWVLLKLIAESEGFLCIGMGCLCWASVSTPQGNVQVGLEVVAGELVFIVDLLAGEVIHPKFHSWV